MWHVFFVPYRLSWIGAENETLEGEMAVYNKSCDGTW